MPDGCLPLALEPDDLQVLVAPEPFRPRVVRLATPPGLTVAEILLEACRSGALDPQDLARTEVDIDGVRILDRESIADIVPNLGQLVNVTVSVHGGKGGSSKALEAALQVAIMVAAFAVAGPAGSAASSWAQGLNLGANLVKAAATAARLATIASVELAGGSLLNAIFKPAAASTGAAAYSLEQQGNQARLRQPFPLCLGEQRWAFDLASSAYTSFLGDDMWICAIYALHFGPCTLTDLKIGETLLSAYPSDEVQTEYFLTPGPRDSALYPTDVHQDSFQNTLDREHGNTVTETSADNATSIELDFIWAGGLYFQKSDGRTVNSDTKIYIEVSPYGANNWQPAPSLGAGVDKSGNHYPAGTYYIQAATKDPLRRTAVIPLPSVGKWDVRVHRDTRATDDAANNDTVTWTALRTPRPGKPVLDEMLSILVLKVKASQDFSGSLGVVSGVVTPICPVPGVDGSWADSEPTSNAAALARWLLTGPASARPLGIDEIDGSFADQYDLIEAQGWQGGPLVTDNSTQEDVLNKLSAAGRFAIYWSGSAMVATPDWIKPAPRQIFAGRNAQGYKRKRTYPDPVHALWVEFANSAADYKADGIFVFNDGYDASTATLIESISLPYPATPDRAHKEGRVALARRENQVWSHEWTAFADAIACSFGDRVRARRTSALYGQADARVSYRRWLGGLVSGVRLDSAVTMVTGESYAIDVRRPDGLQLGLPLITAPGTTREVQFATPLSVQQAPLKGDLISFGRAGHVLEDVEIVDLTPQAGGTVRVQAVNYVGPAIEAAETGEIPALESFLSTRVAAPTPRILSAAGAPSGVTVTFDVEQQRTAPLRGFVARWRITPGEGAASNWSTLDLIPPSERRAVTPAIPAAQHQEGDEDGEIRVDMEIWSVLVTGEPSPAATANGILVRQGVLAVAGFDADGDVRSGNDGSSYPVLAVRADRVLSGAVSDLVVEYQPAGADPEGWKSAGQPLAAANPVGDFTSVAGGKVYDVRGRWRDANGWLGDWTIKLSVAIPEDGLVSADTAKVAGMPAATVLDRISAVETSFSDAVAEVAADAAAAEAAKLASESAASASTSAAANAATAYTSSQAARDAALAAQTAASGSATGAAGSAATASTAATNAQAALTSATTAATTATTQAGNASTSATAASGYASTASTAASNAATANTAAQSAMTTAQGAATTATNQATAASGSAGAAAGSATTATNQASAAAGSASAAAGSATSATTQAGNASVSAGQAATSATVAQTAATTATTQASNASGSATAASTSATNAATSATNAGNSASAASTSATTATTQAGNASTSATNAATSAATATGAANTATTQAGVAATQAANAASSASAASTSASTAGTSATNAGTSATAAAGSATTATTQAGNASTSASNAATSATTATGAANTATTQAGVATTQAGNALGSANAASTSATSAGTQATNAANSASAASASNVAASTTAASLLPSTFGQSGTFFTASPSTYSSPPILAAGAGVSFPTVTGSGVVVQSAAVRTVVGTQGLITLTAGHSYNVTASVITSADVSSGNPPIAIAGFAVFNAAGSYLGNVTAATSPQMSAATGRVNLGSGVGIATSSIVSTYSTAAYIRPIVTLNDNGAGAATTATVQLQSLFATDFTNAAAAAASASAAATSASNASSSQTAAGTAATAAQTSATNASTSAGNASTSASQASTSATNAAGSATTAGTSATNAANSATAASGSASAASGSASTASTQATNASNSATSAQGYANTASSQAGNASTSAGAAATSASAASTSASNAASSASAASNSNLSATTTAAALLPSEFGQDGTFYTNDYQTFSTPAAVASGTFATNTTYGRAYQVTTLTYLAARGTTELLALHAYRLAANWIVTANAGSGANPGAIAGWSVFNASGTYLGTYTETFDGPHPAADGLVKTGLSLSVTTETIRAASGLSTAAYVRPLVVLNTSATLAATTGTSQLLSLRHSDVTSEVASAGSASAAASSASNASASQTAAASSATSASTSANTATTQAGNASTSATNAATSATNANTSANTASTQATNASNSATAAAGSSTSASGYASTASTQATNAANSATSAQGFSNTASSQAGNASTSAGAASTSASGAATSASNAASSASAAAAASVSATTTAASLLPSDFRNDGQFWTNDYGTYASPAAVSTGSFVNGTYGRAWWVTGYAALAARGLTTLVAAHSYRVSTTWALTANPPSGTSGAAVGWAVFDATGAFINYYGVAGDSTRTVSSGLVTLGATGSLSTEVIRATSGFANAVYVRPIVLVNVAPGGGAAASTIQVFSLAHQDVTSEVAAGGSASAAATSASNAAASQTAAGTSASTATAQANTATTQAGNASTSAGQAATSASNASTSANSASTYATNAATSASGASSSSGTASTAATNANNSATAAATSATNASTSAGNAATSAGAASSSSAAATSSAAAAAQSATLSASISGNYLNANSSFAGYPTTPGLPTGWSDWGHGAAGTRGAGEVSGGYSYRLAMTAATDTWGLLQPGTFYITAGDYVLEASVQCEAGNYTGGGLLLQPTSSGTSGTLNFLTDKDSSGATGASSLGIRRWSKLITISSTGTYNLYAMTQYSGFGANTQKTLTWFKAGVRPASAQESLAGVANTTANTAAANIASNQAAQASVNTAQAATNTTTSATLGNSSPNIIKNGSFAAGLTNWAAVGGMSASVDPQLGPYASLIAAAGTQVFTTTDLYPVYAGATLSFGFNGSSDAPSQAYAYLQFLNASGTVTASCPAVNPASWGSRVYSTPLVAPAGTTQFQLVFVKPAGSGTYFQFNQVKVNFNGRAPWSDEASAAALSASVSVQAISIATLQSRTAAYFVTVAADSSSATLQMYADGHAGSLIRLKSDIIALGANDVFTISAGRVHVSATTYTDIGSTRRMDGIGFGANSDLLIWVGTTSYDETTATKNNAKLYVGIDGVLGIGGVATGGSPMPLNGVSGRQLPISGAGFYVGYGQGAQTVSSSTIVIPAGGGRISLTGSGVVTSASTGGGSPSVGTWKLNLVNLTAGTTTQIASGGCPVLNGMLVNDVVPGLARLSGISATVAAGTVRLDLIVTGGGGSGGGTGQISVDLVGTFGTA